MCVLVCVIENRKPIPGTPFGVPECVCVHMYACICMHACMSLRTDKPCPGTLLRVHRKTDYDDKVFPWHPPNHSYRQVRRNGSIQYYSALKKLRVLHMRSHWRSSLLFARGRHRARFVHLVYFSYLTCSIRLRSRCLSSRRLA